MKNYKYALPVLFLFLGAVGIYSLKTISDNAYLQKSIQCREIGSKAYREDMKVMYDNEESDSSRYSVYEPEFAYSKSLKTCLYAGGHVIYWNPSNDDPNSKQKGHDLVQRIIKDVYKNKEVASTDTGFFYVADEDFNNRKLEQIKAYEEVYAKNFK